MVPFDIDCLYSVLCNITSDSHDPLTQLACSKCACMVRHPKLATEAEGPESKRCQFINLNNQCESCGSAMGRLDLKISVHEMCTKATYKCPHKSCLVVGLPLAQLPDHVRNCPQRLSLKISEDLVNAKSNWDANSA